jgi:hypothetical protein
MDQTEPFVAQAFSLQGRDSSRPGPIVNRSLEFGHFVESIPAVVGQPILAAAAFQAAFAPIFENFSAATVLTPGSSLLNGWSQPVIGLTKRWVPGGERSGKTKATIIWSDPPPSSREFAHTLNKIQSQRAWSPTLSSLSGRARKPAETRLQPGLAAPLMLSKCPNSRDRLLIDPCRVRNKPWP